MINPYPVVGLKAMLKQMTLDMKRFQNFLQPHFTHGHLIPPLDMCET